MEWKEDWCRSVTSTFRARKKKAWETFKQELFYEPFALTLPSIVIWARCYHLHIALFFNYGYWTTHYKHDLKQYHVFLLFCGNNIYDDTRMITSPEYKERYREISRTSRKIERYLNRRREQLRKKVEEETSSSNNTNKTDVQGQSDQQSVGNTDSEKSDGKQNGEQSDVDLEQMLENSVDKSNTEGNNVQKDVTQMEEENEKQIEEGVNSNVQKQVTNKTESEETETEVDVVQTDDKTGKEEDEEMLSVDNKQPSDTEVDAMETDDKTLKDQDEEMITVQNKQPSDTTKENEVDAIETDDKQEDNMDNKTNNDHMHNHDQTDVTDTSKQRKRKKNVDNVQNQQERRISPHTSSAAKVANKLVFNARSKIKGSWEYVNKERAKITKCFICGLQKNTLKALEKHIRIKHKSYRYKCSYCRKKY